jgi:CRISPR-associated protein Csb2
MLGIEVELLGGRFVASAYNDREVAEWPPHPARLFSALVATWAEGEPDSPEASEERAALEWLEAQPAPAIVADRLGDIARRTVVPVFVPVNDSGVIAQPDGKRSALLKAEADLAAATDAKQQKKAEQAVQKARAALAKATQDAIAAVASPKAAQLAEAQALFPDGRGKQPRTFPSITPPTPRVRYLWSDAEVPSDVEQGLTRLTSRLVRLGHSSTLVSSRLSREPAKATYVVDESHGELTLRWVARGQLARLQEAYARHQEVEPRVMPATFVSYREAEDRPSSPVPFSCFSPDFIVFARVGGPRFPTTSTAGLSRQFSRALQSVAPGPIPEIISGHMPDGSPSQRPHLAILALPFVGHEHADGGVRGMALVLPRDVSPDERRAVMTAIARLEENARRLSGSEEDPPPVPLHLGDSGTLELQRLAWSDGGMAALRASTWTHPAREWVTATPIALDANPGDLHDENPDRRARAFAEAEASVARSVEHLGLPTPIEIEVSRSVLLSGTAKPRAFPRFPVSRERPQRVLVHARIAFATAVRGPVVLGAGRYLGLGLCRPISGGRDHG